MQNFSKPACFHEYCPPYRITGQKQTTYIHIRKECKLLSGNLNEQTLTH